MHPAGAPRRQPSLLDAARWLGAGLVLLGALSAGCSKNQAVSLNSLDADTAQWEIAMYYQREAAALKQRADEQAARMVVYEQLFGPKSDWVAGARKLREFYEESAREKEQLAELHRQLAPRSMRLSPR
jgi:hypothetical protein